MGSAGNLYVMGTLQDARPSVDKNRLMIYKMSNTFGVLQQMESTAAQT